MPIHQAAEHWDLQQNMEVTLKILTPQVFHQ